jgi:hypothetical protein
MQPYRASLRVFFDTGTDIGGHIIVILISISISYHTSEANTGITASENHVIVLTTSTLISEDQLLHNL